MFIIVFLLILSILVLVHELGHFLMAKRMGVRVLEFGIGFPPRIWGIKKGETTYSINALPIGGFVKLYGEEYAEISEKNRRDDQAHAFIHKKPWQKALIVVAGVVLNFLLGWILISYLYTQGVPTPSNTVMVESVQKDSPAQVKGVKPGDVIISIQKDTIIRPIKSVDDLIQASKQFGDEVVSVTLQNSQGQRRIISMIPRKNPPKNQGAFGVVVTSYIIKQYPWYSAWLYGLTDSFRITGTIVTELGKTLYRIVALQPAGIDVSGPIGIARYTDTAMKHGSRAILELLALLSLNLGVINILPFPALDGGRLVFIVYEGITKKKPNPSLEKYVNMAGILFLLGLALVISIFDIVKIVSK